jgi:nitrate reductase beta subunit
MAGYANHILNKNYAYGNIDDTMDIIKIENNDILRDTFERNYIYKAQQEGIHLNDTHANTKNPIFETVYKYQEKINYH